ncbi:MAG: beta-lactamase family protein [Verrucomicrobia bacterium]|nr:beta-lactamase family protein [Verrucomicrobiota bacterium]
MSVASSRWAALPLCTALLVPPFSSGAAETQSIDKLLELIRKQHDLPALAAAVVKGGRTVALGAVGFRKYGETVKVTSADQFHIGSCTESMTATFVAMLVEQGRLSWDTTIANVFPDLAASMQPQYRDVTLEQLLSHRGGFPNETAPPGKTLLDLHKLAGTRREQRRAYLEMALRTPPEARPGEKFIYSNMGYVVVGAMAEKVMNASWEDLTTRMLFKPLGMTSAGFGAMGTPGKIDQPWQHALEATNHHAIGPGPRSDNPLVIGPAGTVYCSLGDWAKFVAIHVRGETNWVGLLKPETFRKLHTPMFGGDYAFGWAVANRKWGGGRVLTHNGSNNQNFAVVWIAPLRDFAVLVATNQGGDEGAKACDETAAALIKEFLSKSQ